MASPSSPEKLLRKIRQWFWVGYGGDKNEWVQLIDSVIGLPKDETPRLHMAHGECRTHPIKVTGGNKCHEYFDDIEAAGEELLRRYEGMVSDG
jgi:hypothetical protein